MTSINILRELHAANHWANKSLLELIPEDLYVADAKGSYNSIKALYTHIWDAQTVWYNRLTGNANAAMPSKSFEGDYDALRAAILVSSENYCNLLADKTDGYLGEMLHYTNLQGKTFEQPNYQILLQITHHSSYHRGQVVDKLRALGFDGKIPQTDVIAWYRLNG